MGGRWRTAIGWATWALFGLGLLIFGATDYVNTGAFLIIGSILLNKVVSL